MNLKRKINKCWKNSWGKSQHRPQLLFWIRSTDHIWNHHRCHHRFHLKPPSPSAVEIALLPQNRFIRISSFCKWVGFVPVELVSGSSPFDMFRYCFHSTAIVVSATMVRRVGSWESMNEMVEPSATAVRGGSVRGGRDGVIICNLKHQEFCLIKKNFLAPSR